MMHIYDFNQTTLNEKLKTIKCVYELPIEIKSKEEFENLIKGFQRKETARIELWNQPQLLGLVGPMFNGYTTYNGKKTAIIRYETMDQYLTYD